MYTRERHRAYAGIYKRLLKAEGAINGLWGFTYDRTYEDASKADVEALLKSKRIPGKPANDILSLWDTNGKRAREMLSDNLQQWKRNRASHALTLARNYQLLNELYCSGEARDRIDNAYHALVRYWVRAKNEERDYEIKLPDLKDTAASALVDVRNTLSAELMRGDSTLTTSTTIALVPAQGAVEV